MNAIMIRRWSLAGAAALAAACTSGHAANDTARARSGGTAAEAPPTSTTLRLASGTAVSLRSRVAITSRRNHAGDPVEAAAATAAVGADGDTVIPAGAVFHGRIAAVSPAPHPGEQGTLRIAFTDVSIRGTRYPVHGDVTWLGTRMKGRGVTAGTAAKVGAGALIGGVAGRIIGGGATGTVVGAVAGGAGGAVVAHATRTMDIVLPAGGEIRYRLTQPFERVVASRGSRPAPPVATPNGGALAAGSGGPGA